MYYFKEETEETDLFEQVVQRLGEDERHRDRDSQRGLSLLVWPVRAAQEVDQRREHKRDAEDRLSDVEEQDRRGDHLADERPGDGRARRVAARRRRAEEGRVEPGAGVEAGAT